MKKTTCLFLGFLLLSAGLSPYGKSDKTPKLECKKLALMLAKAFEERDAKTLSELTGELASEEEVAQFKAQMDMADEQGLLAPWLEGMRAFPEISDMPDWVTHATIEYEYFDGKQAVEFDAEFLVVDGSWQVKQFTPDGRGEFVSEGDKERFLNNSLPAAEGQNTVDPGINDVIAKLAKALMEDDRKTFKALTGFKGVSEYWDNKARNVQLLSEFPKIGPMPAPLHSLKIELEEAADDEETSISVEFRWREKKLDFGYLELI